MELGKTQVTRQPKKQVVCYQLGKPGYFARDCRVRLSAGGNPGPGHAQVNHINTEHLPLPPLVNDDLNSLEN